MSIIYEYAKWNTATDHKNEYVENWYVLKRVSLHFQVRLHVKDQKGLNTLE